jgi:hypothetical protein
MRTPFDNLNVKATGRQQTFLGKTSLVGALLAASLLLSGAVNASDTPSASVRSASASAAAVTVENTTNFSSSFSLSLVCFSL